jgi:hypothetical protein
MKPDTSFSELEGLRPTDEHWAEWANGLAPDEAKLIRRALGQPRHERADTPAAR